MTIDKTFCSANRKVIYTKAIYDMMEVICYKKR